MKKYGKTKKNKSRKKSQKKNNRIEEKATGHAIKIGLNTINKVSKSICKIYIEKNQGTGFFMLLNNTIKCVITNYHIISKDSINKNINIEIYNNKKINIKLNNRTFSFFEDLDITIIEIKDTDSIIQYINFLDYDSNYIKGYEQYINLDVFSLQYPKDEIQVGMGKIIQILDHAEFKHTIDTDYGSSGSPIILPNFLKVIGIHKSGDKYAPLNYGSFIGEIFKGKFGELLKPNYIIGKFNISKDKIGKQIRIINSYENFSFYITDEDNHENDNEKEIKKFIIEINNKKIPFSYYHKFEKEGINKIKYTFKNHLINSNYMFAQCNELKSLDLTNLITLNITNMNHMFYQCNFLEDINLSNFNTEKVKDMNSLFAFCGSLKNLDLSKFNTKNVIDMSCMFFYCSSLENLNLLNFNTQNVKNMCFMFSSCISLKYLDLSNFNTENVENMMNMFCGCNFLRNLDISNFNVKKVDSMRNMFVGCSSLETLDLSSFNIKENTDTSGMFASCKAHEEKKIRANDPKIITLFELTYDYID